MRITRGETICGVEAMALRSALRRADAYSAEWLGSELGLDVSGAARLIDELCGDGYLAERPAGSKVFRVTLKGSAFRMATAARPITRATADRLVQDIVRRAEEVNDADYAYKVGALVVFGSYCDPEADRLSDVDVAARWLPVDDFQPVCERRIRLASVGGRRFYSDLEEMSWPEIEVKRHLKGRSASLSLHDYDKTLPIVISGHHEVVFGEVPVVDATLNSLAEHPGAIHDLGEPPANLREPPSESGTSLEPF